MMTLVMVMMITMHDTRPRQWSSRLSGARQSHIQRPLHLLFVLIAGNLPFRVQKAFHLWVSILL